MIIRDQFDPDLRKKIKQKKQIAIIPVGSIEQHGPHLPISTDSDIVTEISLRFSEKINGILLPTINYGISDEHFPFFNLSVKKSTLSKMLDDICESLIKNGISRILIINGHYGNLESLKGFERKKKRNRKIKVLSYWKYMDREFDHAGNVETSIMLAISKNVKMKNAKKGFQTDGMSKQEISKINKLAQKSFPKVTGNGVWGDPTKSSAKLGRKIINEVVNNLVKESNLTY
ncbi:MAG: creatininase family protein [Thermoproteota archaeon]|jgi:creatinine amidohydrolase|nr:creatininase family protein [Thermoproteota archaeon]MEC9063312.1 creatininase family protein [Thermoproteota archaeon]MED5543241.1 creatininase family protein [Thermoproteota archaeon]